MSYAEVRDRMVACGLWINIDDSEPNYKLGHVECHYGREGGNPNYILTGYVMLDRFSTISADQFDCFFCNKVMGPEAG
jgi:hypothetical protein